MARRTIVAELMRRDLCADEESALRLLAEGRVHVNGAIATNASRQVAPADAVRLVEPPARYVSRGGNKLESALHAFDVRVEGKSALDAGSSTGGFTDCLLQHGASAVLALDVGINQLHERLRADRRVTSMEQTNLRHADVDALGMFDLVTADLSFISLRAVAEQLTAATRPDGGDLIVLVKPQFESTREEASKRKGVIADPVVWRRVLGEVLSAMETSGAATMGVVISPVRGASGNVEFLAHLRRGASPGDLTEMIAGAVEQAEGLGD